MKVYYEAMCIGELITYLANGIYLLIYSHVKPYIKPYKAKFYIRYREKKERQRPRYNEI